MQTLFIGKNLIFLPQIHSTNSYAIDLLKNVKPAEGTVVYTHHQTHGKGQRGALWEAEKGQNLTASIILNPYFIKPEQQFFLYQISALACYDTITELLKQGQIDIKIKWPNDILLRNKKVSGILIENSIQGSQITGSVIGIGLNVNQTHFAQDIKATSLCAVSNLNFDISKVLADLCKHLEKYYLYLRQLKLDEIQELYIARLFGFREFHAYKINNTLVSLKVIGVSHEGLLVLEDSSGKLHKADVKEAQLQY